MTVSITRGQHPSFKYEFHFKLVHVFYFNRRGFKYSNLYKTLSLDNEFIWIQIIRILKLSFNMKLLSIKQGVFYVSKYL